jgi:hypothetical protein
MFIFFEASSVVDNVRKSAKDITDREDKWSWCTGRKKSRQTLRFGWLCLWNEYRGRILRWSITEQQIMAENVTFPIDGGFGFVRPFTPR